MDDTNENADAANQPVDAPAEAFEPENAATAGEAQSTEPERGYFHGQGGGAGDV